MINDESEKDLIGDLHARAIKAIPGGNSLLSKRREMYAPGQWPAFFDEARGIVVTDINGKEYRDFSNFSVGTNTLGYGNRNVDAAVIRCIRRGNMSTLNPPEEVYLAERLVELHPWSSMVRFARTGGEANSIAIRIARAFTGKDKIAFCGYHGWHDWYLSANLQDSKNLDKQLLSGLSTFGVPIALAGSSIPFLEGDLEGLETILRQGDVAAIKMEVMRSKEPSLQYLRDIKELATKYNCLLVFDECTSGFRETFGGLHLKYGIEPDLAVLGKTLGNGYAITSVIGTKRVMSSGETTFISSSFFTERIGFVAGLAALEEMDRLKSWQVITSIGKAFKKRLQLLADKHSLMIDITGMDALTTYNFKYKNPLEIKTFVIQEMLKEKFLTSNVFYSSVEHSQKDMDAFFESLDKVFFKLAKVILNNEDITKYLDGAICHSGFQRLN